MKAQSAGGTAAKIRRAAASIRDVIRYIERFQNALLVIYLDDKLLDSPVFLQHIKDISLLHRSGLRVILVPGAAKRIDEILSKSGIAWQMKDGSRVTSPQAMPLIKMAAFDVSNQVMTALAGEKITALIGNWVRARSKGIIGGFDYGTVGTIDRIETDALEKVLSDGFIPIFPCIGWSLAGKPYNISSLQLAERVASHLHADKLFYLVPGASISAERFAIPEEIGLSEDKNLPALNLEELDEFIKTNQPPVNSEDSAQVSPEFTERSANPDVLDNKKIFELLDLARRACSSGVSRVHILDGSEGGTLLCEIFSDLGSGTMIYVKDYGRIRNMTIDDIPAVLGVMQPFVEKGNLLPRTKQNLEDQIDSYIVYELDGAIRSCASLIPYSDGQMEIAGIAVEASCSQLGIGPKMIEFLVKRAKSLKAKSIFLLTTQTSDWFESLGFKPSTVSSLPEQRKSMWTPERGSVVYRLEK